MMRMFSMVEIGERGGNDMDKIFGGWGMGQIRGALLRRGLRPGPHYVHASARFCRFDQRRSAEIGRNGDGSAKSAILAYLSQFGPAKRSELEKVTGLGTSRVNDLLRELTADGSIVAEGATRSRRYRLSE